MECITVGWATCFDSWERMVMLPRSKSSKAELCSPDTRGRSIDFSVFSTNQIFFPLLWSPISYSLKALTAKVAIALGRTEAVQIFKMPQSWQTGPTASPTTESRHSPWCPEVPVTHQGCTTCPWFRSQSVSSYLRTWKPGTGKTLSHSMEHLKIRLGLF